uniref:LCCL domain-containing protein n=1 Tax=Branchiostoma floridae TaxID=7739 RepID=C3ZHS4_BRAFL|eukprot:XP_002591857.1 hypothetical protein BRAFLDRAFT_89367 [Branchiostoma floridae]
MYVILNTLEPTSDDSHNSRGGAQSRRVVPYQVLNPSSLQSDTGRVSVGQTTPSAYGETTSAMWRFSGSISIFVLLVFFGHPSEERTLLPSTNPTQGYIRREGHACPSGLFDISSHGNTNLATCAHLCTVSGSCGAFVHVPGDSASSCTLKQACPTPANVTGADLYFKRLCNATAPLSWNSTESAESVFTIVCPPGCASVATPIYGDGMYSANSPVCKAAVHHGWIRDELGGAVTVRKYPTNLDQNPPTSTRNGVTALW